MKRRGTLLLLPNLLGECGRHAEWLPAGVDRAVEALDGIIAESVRGGRRFLSRFKTKKGTHQTPLAVFNKRTPDADLDFLLEPIVDGEQWGLVTDAGMPCVADPGSKLVFRARQRGLAVKAFVGPSSILMALMLSGLPGQCFAFLGYLDKDPRCRKRQIIALERRSKEDKATQIFMEAPHRNMHTLQALVETLNEDTLLCVCWDLTLPTESVVTQRVCVWRKMPPPGIHKKPALFLVLRFPKKFAC